VWLNRSKESLTLNLKEADAKEILLVLLSRADVFVQNLALARRHVCPRRRSTATRLSVTHRLQHHGIRNIGSLSDKKAYDLLIQSETGLLSITGTATVTVQGRHFRCRHRGWHVCLSGILTALLSRPRTGHGTVVDVSLFEALGEWMGYPAYYSYSGEAPGRAGASHAAIAPTDRSRAATAKRSIWASRTSASGMGSAAPSCSVPI